MRVPLIAAAALAAATALPAAAQVYTYDDGTVVDEVIVSPIGPYRNGPDRMSQRVSLSDLDLTTYAGRQVMRLRVRDAARNVCRALGEGPGNGGPLLRSCEDQAIRDTAPQMRVAVNEAIRSRAYAYNDLGAYPYDWRY
jgi:UrcA family protein